ncbi:MAG: PEGA domain-containing protein [Armatimonadetes bacterium]|nr:PEGA domain-containing protein [Armatimonadota bacterium]
MVGAAARAAGLVAVALLDPPPAAAAAAAEPAFDLRIESVPTGAEVSVDGKPQGLTPLRVAGLHGRPTVTVRRPGYKDWEAQLTANGSLSLQAQLVSMFGGLVVTSPRPGARVLVDGKEQGATPLRLTGVADGVHEVKLLAEGRPAEVRQVMVRAGQTVQVSFGAEPASVTGEGPRPGVIAPGLPRHDALRVGAVLWERKVDLLGPGGKPAKMHLVIARLGEGCLFSATLAPPQAYETRPTAGALTCTWPGLRTATARTWSTPEVGLITSVAQAPSGGGPGGLEVRVQPASGVTVKVHASSTLERVRLVLAR